MQKYNGFKIYMRIRVERKRGEKKISISLHFIINLLNLSGDLKFAEMNVKKVFFCSCGFILTTSQQSQCFVMFIKMKNKKYHCRNNSKTKYQNRWKRHNWYLNTQMTAHIHVLCISRSYGNMVVKFKRWWRKLGEKAHEYTVSFLCNIYIITDGFTTTCAISITTKVVISNPVHG